MKKLIIGIFIIILLPYLVVMTLHNNKKSEIPIFIKIDNEIKKVPLEEYVECVLLSEAPISFHPEALKAISISIRTYALKKMEDNEYIDDTTKYQVYVPLKRLKEKFTSSDIDKIKDIVKSTKGEYMVYNDEIIDSLYFSTSIGKTENSIDIFSKELPYLKSVESPWDETSPVFSETKTLELPIFLNKLNLENSDTLRIEILDTTLSGRIKKIKINNKEFSGDEVREKLDLRSNYFEITKLDTNVLISTKGYGHGVGLSLYGANGMANEGYNYIDILRYYYQGIKIKKIIV